MNLAVAFRKADVPSISRSKYAITSLLVSALCFLLATQYAVAQTPCPTGSVLKTIIRPMSYNGVCCDVEITYCLGPNNSIVLFGATVLDASCWGLTPGSPLPFSENYLVNYVRDLVVRDALKTTVSTCPTMTTTTLSFSTSSCAELKTQTVDPDGRSGPLPEVLQLYLAWCIEVVCTRTCYVCADPSNLDPCTQEPRLYFECNPTFDPGCPGVPVPSNCTSLCGS